MPMEAASSKLAGIDPSTILRLASARRRREQVSLAALAAVVLLTIVITFAVRGIRQNIPLTNWLIVVALALAQAVFSAWNARCPACEQHLGVGIVSAYFCPQCGVRLKSHVTSGLDA